MAPFEIASPSQLEALQGVSAAGMLLLERALVPLVLIQLSEEAQNLMVLEAQV